MTITSEQDTIPAPGSDAEGVAGGNLDKVRDLLFGGQMRDYNRKFARLEERLTKETADLRDDVKQRLAGLEAYLKAEVESLSERLRSEQESLYDRGTAGGPRAARHRAAVRSEGVAARRPDRAWSA